MAENIYSARPIAAVAFRDDGRYEVTCPKGHTSITILQEQKFEVLFDIGAYAIVDGYYREAVSSFTSSLERFYEFFVRACLLEKGLDGITISETWKLVARQSERQFGAYAFLYANEYGTSAPTLSDKRVAFRNKVIHKGKIPLHEEAVAYGQAVLDVIRPVLRQAKDSYPEGIMKTIRQHMRKCHSSKDKGRPVSTISVPTIIRLSAGESPYDELSLEETIKDLPRWDVTALHWTLIPLRFINLRLRSGS